MPSTRAVVVVGAVIALSGCHGEQPSAHHLSPSVSPAAIVVTVDLTEGQQVEKADRVGDIVAVHLHKTGAINSDWKGPSYSVGPGMADGGAAPQVPYPEPVQAGVFDQYFAFRAKHPGLVGIGFGFPTSCTGAIPCLASASLLTLRISR
jgi:hypothetical protein